MLDLIPWFASVLGGTLPYVYLGAIGAWFGRGMRLIGAARLKKQRGTIGTPKAAEEAAEDSQIGSLISRYWAGLMFREMPIQIAKSWATAIATALFVALAIGRYEGNRVWVEMHLNMEIDELGSLMHGIAGAGSGVLEAAPVLRLMRMMLKPRRGKILRGFSRSAAYESVQEMVQSVYDNLMSSVFIGVSIGILDSFGEAAAAGVVSGSIMHLLFQLMARKQKIASEATPVISQQQK